MSENNSIREEIDRIEPADGAKERMLRNIRQKAEEQQTKGGGTAEYTGSGIVTFQSDTVRENRQVGGSACGMPCDSGRWDSRIPAAVRSGRTGRVLGADGKRRYGRQSVQ